LKAGISRLNGALQPTSRKQAEFYLELANAYTKTRQHNKAFHWYEEAIRRKPEFSSGPAQLRRRALPNRAVPRMS